MPFPTAIVEIAFDDGPYVLNPTWTDVTSWVYSMDIERGRSDDWGQFDSFATVVLNNRTRRFDPYFTTGPYFGKLLPRKQIRIRATYGATTHDVFRGFIDGWDPNWTDAGGNSTVTVSCFDALQLLSAEQLPADWAMNYILALNPRHYWELDDPITAFTTSDYVLRDRGNTPSRFLANRVDIVQGPEIAYGLPSRSVQTATALGPNDFSEQVPNTTFSNWSISYWTIAANAEENASFFSGYMFGGNFVMFQHTDTQANDYGKFEVQFITPANQHTWKTVNHYEPGLPYMFTFTYNATGAVGTIYVNGVADTGVKQTSAGTPLYPFERYALSYGAFQQLFALTTTLTQTQVRDIYNLGTAAFPETTSARINRLIAETTFPTALVSVPASPANSVLYITPDASRVTEEMRIVADSEQAPLFVSKNGTVTMFSQTQIFSQTKSIQSQVTYGSGGAKLDPSITITADGDSLRNSVYVTMSGGGVYEQANTTSGSTYGVASASIDTQVQTVANAQSVANIVTGWGSYVYPALSPAKVVISPDSDWSPTLGLELMDRVTVNIAPPTGNVISTPMLVQKIRHEVVPGQWVTTLEGSARWAAVFIVGQSLIGGTDLLA